MARPIDVEKVETKRIQMDLAPKSLGRLKRLQEITEAASYAEVIRNALRLYEAIIEESESGAELKIVKNGQISSFHIFSGYTCIFYLGKLPGDCDFKNLLN